MKDTDLVSTVVYAHHYYGACPAWIEQRARERLGHLYLLLAPDVPWLADGLQRDGPGAPHQRSRLFGRTLRVWKAHVVEIGGTWDERRARALEAVAGDRQRGWPIATGGSGRLMSARICHWRYRWYAPLIAHFGSGTTKFTRPASCGIMLRGRAPPMPNPTGSPMGPFVNPIAVF